MSETRATWGAGFIAGLAAKVMDAENQADLAYSLALKSALGVEKNNFTSLFKERSTTNARETFVGKTGISWFEETTESSDYHLDSRVPTYETHFNPIKKTQGIEITEEERDDMDKGIQNKMDRLRDLKVSYMMTVDRDGFSVFNNAFTAQASLPNHLTYFLDGKPLCSIAHPLKDSVTSTTTQSNANADGLALTEVNLEIGRLALRGQKDDRGMPMAIGSSNVILLVPDSLEKLAVQITQSKKRQNTANNDLNIYEGIVTVISTKWINGDQPAIGGVGSAGSNTAWFLIDTMNSPLIAMTRRGFTTRIWEKNSNKNIIVDASMRAQTGWINFRGIWGSKGDTVAYAG